MLLVFISLFLFSCMFVCCEVCFFLITFRVTKISKICKKNRTLRSYCRNSRHKSLNEAYQNLFFYGDLVYKFKRIVGK